MHDVCPAASQTPRARHLRRLPSAATDSLGGLATFLAGGALAGTTTERLTVDFSLPGEQGYETERQIV